MSHYCVSDLDLYCLQIPGNIGYNKPQTIYSTNGKAKKALLCINYNERLCQRPACKFMHLCFDCFRPHPKTKCPIKTHDKGENNIKGKDKKPQEKSEKSNQCLHKRYI